MGVWQAAMLGLIQGLTEFLPVSSSGHLALAQMLIPGFRQPGVVFDAMLHVGTAVAILVFERRTLVELVLTRPGRKLAVLLAFGTVATAVVAFPVRRLAEDAFTSALWVGCGLLVTAIVVWTARADRNGSTDEHTMGWRETLVVGLVQGLTVFPGVSRSGSTIAAGLGIGLDRLWAARFSFLLSVPAVLGAAAASLVLERGALADVEPGFWLAAATGAAIAAVSGYVALRLVIRTVTSHSFHRFAWYCLPLGLLVLALHAGGLV